MRAQGHHSQLWQFGNSCLIMATCLCWFAIITVHDVLLCWLCEAKTVVGLSYIMSPLGGAVCGGRDFRRIFFGSSQEVASGSCLLFCKFKQTLVISASGKSDVDLRRKPACHWTPREWATGSLKHLFLTSFPSLLPLLIPSALNPQALTEGMYFRRDPWWCDGHERPVWNGNPHILPCQGAPGISQQRWWKEMEQVKKNSHLHWRFPFKNTSKYSSSTFYSGCAVL